MSLSLVTKVRYINRHADIPLRGRKGEAERSEAKRREKGRIFNSLAFKRLTDLIDLIHCMHAFSGAWKPPDFCKVVGHT